jgi:hypothetical protein
MSPKKDVSSLIISSLFFFISSITYSPFGLMMYTFLRSISELTM